MQKNKTVVCWLKRASTRHDEIAWDIALRHGEQAANTYLDGIDYAVKLIQENPRIGKNIWPHLPHRHRYVTSRSWEIVYDDDKDKSRIVIIDIQRGAAKS